MYFCHKTTTTLFDNDITFKMVNKNRSYFSHFSHFLISHFSHTQNGSLVKATNDASKIFDIVAIDHGFSVGAKKGGKAGTS